MNMYVGMCVNIYIYIYIYIISFTYTSPPFGAHEKRFRIAAVEAKRCKVVRLYKYDEMCRITNYIILLTHSSSDTY